MSNFEVHTLETAPDAAKSALESAKKKFGFVPNLMAMLAEAPATLAGYEALAATMLTKSSFTLAEAQIIALSASYENGCGYCKAAHSYRAGQIGIPENVIEAFRDGSPFSDPRLEALRVFTTKVVKNRGRLGPGDLHVFLSAGFTREQSLDVVLGVAWKTLSNYANHIMGTPLDEGFKDAPLAAPEADYAIARDG